MTAFDRLSMTVELEILFRLANKDDLKKLEWYGQYTHFRNLIRRAYREQLRGQRLMLLADLNDFPIGQLFIQLNSANPLIADGHRRGYLYSFRIMDMFQGQGIGTRLLHEAEQMLVDRGYRYATISVAKDNPRAQRLYEREGYHTFSEDAGRWSYIDHRGITRHVEEPSGLSHQT